MSHKPEKLRVLTLTPASEIDVDTRPLYCPDCHAKTATGWCQDCGFDWPDGCTAQLKAANPHVYGSSGDIECELIALSSAYSKSGRTDEAIAEKYRYLHSVWMAAKSSVSQEQYRILTDAMDRALNAAIARHRQ